MPGAAPRAAPPPPPAPDLAHQREVLLARQELGFEPRAPLTEAAIQGRRRQLARKYHPDLAGPNAGEREARVGRMARVNAAADLLLAEIG